jgi:2-polyprenyl-3-methyl-5-hydroxy-6-metoxy-1,4-benzoquinol methylase
MLPNRLQKLRQAALELIGALSRFHPRRVARYFKSVSYRLDAILRLIESERAVALDRSRELSLQIELQLEKLPQLEKQIGLSLQVLEQRLVQQVDQLLEQRLEQMAATLGKELDRHAQAQSSQAAEIHAAITNSDDMVRSWNLDLWKLKEYEGLLRYLRRRDYLEAIREGRLVVPRLETEHPVAIASNDTRFPRGAKNDNSIAPRFNRKLREFLAGTPQLRVLDVGCAGGGFVRTLIDDGHFAVGLEGSDYPLLNQTGEWSTIPMHLFTCDITKPLQLYDNATSEPLVFDAITAWEVMEHIPEEGLSAMLENLERHLAPQGYLFFSIATHMDWDPTTGTIWHVTLKPRHWWIHWFAARGFVVEEKHPFGSDDWVRGSGQCRGDWHCADSGNGFHLVDVGMGFHVVLRRKVESGALSQAGPWRRASVA